MYSTLPVLKAYALPKPVQSRDDYDAALQELGNGLAERFNQHCDRTLLRGDHSIIFSGDRRVYVLPSYPVESITSVQTRADYNDTWGVESGMIDQLSNASGLLQLDSADDERSQVRVDWVGGYWVDLTGEDSLPEGATPMPADIRLAWLTQCKHVFDLLDKDGDSFRGADRGLGGALVSLLNIDLLTSVETTLNKYKRYQII
jgi:hypothetical protein